MSQLKRICPHCHFPMSLVRLENQVEIDHCAHCGGSYFDANESEEIFGPLMAEDVWTDGGICKKIGPSKRKSPVSENFMESFEVSFEQEMVLIERCPNSGGLWFDRLEADKLRRIVFNASQDKDHSPGSVKNEMGVGSYLFQLFMSVPLELCNPVRRKPVITLSLIITCVLVFIYQLSLDAPAMQNLLNNYALMPGLFEGEAIAGLIGYMFLHGGFMHLFGNMFSLYIFGDNVEDVLGRKNYIILYLVSGFAGAFVQVLFQAETALPVVGASGAIAGLLGAYAVLFPKVKIRMIFFFIPFYFRYYWYIGVWLFINFSGLMGGEAKVAWLCHLGGFAAGALLALPFRQKDFAEQLALAKS